jgi:hypothetical protein
MSSAKSSRFLGYTAGQLVFALSNEGEPGSKQHQEIKGALSTKLISQLSEAIDRHERAASRLASRILLLDLVVGLFTVVGFILAVMQFVW